MARMMKEDVTVGTTPDSVESSSVEGTLEVVSDVIDVAGTLLHLWERVSGKHRTRDKETGKMKVIHPGATITAPVGAFSKDRQWKDRGPLHCPASASIPEVPPVSDLAQIFSIEKAKGGYNVINAATGQPLNERPLTKREATALLNAPVEND